MKKSISVLFAVLFCGVTALAQVGGGGFDSTLDQLFEKTPVFTATLQTAMTGPNGSMSASTRMYYDHGNSRSEMNMADVSGSTLPPNALKQAQAMGLDKVVTIAPSSKTNIFMIYPNLRAYISNPTLSGAQSPGNLKVTKIGSETVDGHPCVKNQVVLNLGGQPHQFTVWNASDLQNFPIQINITDQGTSATMIFRNISFAGVSTSQFQPPSSYKRYDNIQELMQAAIIGHVGGGTPAATPAQ